MSTRLEAMKEELRKEFECPDHKSMAFPLHGVEIGCDGCAVQVAAIVTKAMGVHVPQPRDPGPPIRLSSDKTRAGVIYDKCRELGRDIGDSCPPHVGFCLMLFEFNGPQLEWICNGQRSDMIKLLDEFKAVLSKETPL